MKIYLKIKKFLGNIFDIVMVVFLPWFIILCLIITFIILVVRSCDNEIYDHNKPICYKIDSLKYKIDSLKKLLK